MKRVMLTRPLRSSQGYVSPVIKNKKEAGGKEPPPPSPSKEGREGVGFSPAGAPEKKSVEQILDEASQLTPTQRKELLARLSLASQTQGKGEARDVDMWSGAVYEGLVRVVGGDGEGVPGPLIVKRFVGCPAAWGPVSSFMRASKMDQLKVTERQGVYNLLAKLVIEQALYVSQNSRAPMSAKLVGNCSSNMTGIFDQAFPGYLNAGLAHMVARRLTTS